jgi:hypothetical protein
MKFAYALIVLLLFGIAPSAFATEQCFDISTVKDSWSRGSETLCVDGNLPSDLFTITLKTGTYLHEATIATFNLSLLSRVRCFGCNKDVFGVAVPSNSAFNSLEIKFDGTVDQTTAKESGTVTIGLNSFYYRTAD